MPEADTVLVAVVGTTGLEPALAALAAGKTLALASKEILVLAGKFVMAAARAHGATLLPVDSEHNAVFQCLEGHPSSGVRRILLTASGGAFRDWPAERLAHATPADALKHPNWSMGPKITVDSATLANKGLELIEAQWLFDLRPDQCGAVLHPPSIVHCLVEFTDGAMLAHLSPPSMTFPIQHALLHPARLPGAGAPLDLTRLLSLEFRPVDEGRFPLLRLARQTMEAGGVAPAVFNAANEVAVMAFLESQIPFLAISHVVEQTLAVSAHLDPPDLPAVLAVDAPARRVAAAQIGLLSQKPPPSRLAWPSISSTPSSPTSGRSSWSPCSSAARSSCTSSAISSAARRRGLHVERFSIGFGPAIWSHRAADGVEYCVAWFPFGGYVLLPQLADLGELEGPSSVTAAQLPPVSYASRLLVLIAGASFNVIFAFVLATIIWAVGQRVDSDTDTTRIGHVLATVDLADGSEVTSARRCKEACRWATSCARSTGERWTDWTRAQLDAIVTGAGARAKDGRPEVIFTVERNGGRLNLTVHPRLTGEDQARQVGISPWLDFIVERFSTPDAPGQKLGFQAGDRILSFDGHPIHDPGDYVNAFAGNRTRAMVARVGRGDQELVIAIPPQAGAALAPPLGIVPNTTSRIIHHPSPFSRRSTTRSLTLRTLTQPAQPPLRRRPVENVGPDRDQPTSSTPRRKPACWSSSPSPSSSTSTWRSSTSCRSPCSTAARS